jgi:tRNA 2-thiouridine synthesizing protein B
MLHTVNKSPTEKSSLLSCLRLAQSGGDILLIEDGVYAAMSGTDSELVIRNALDKHRIYVLEPDLQCRGLQKSRLIPGIQTVDYVGFVQLAADNDAVHSWL